MPEAFWVEIINLWWEVCVRYASFDDLMTRWKREGKPVVKLGAGPEKLDRKRIERLLKSPRLEDLYFGSATDEPVELVIDLRDVLFVDPYPLTVIPALCEEIDDQVHRTWVCLPANPGVKNYCGVSGLIDTLEPVVELVGEGSCVSRRVVDSEVLVALTRIESTTDVEDVTRRAKPTLEALLSRFGWPSEISERTIAALSEIAMNVVEHAESVGFLTLQAYRLDGPEPFLVVSVSDCGVGVRSTLAEKYPRFESEGVGGDEVLMELFQRFLTSRPNQQRGKGIQTLRDAIRTVRGRILFRSGRGCYRERSDRNRASAWTLALMPGTHLRLSFDAPG